MKILKGQDLTKLPFPVDAIMNSANAEMRPGGGVCGAIFAHDKDKMMEKRCASLVSQYGPMRDGEAAVTESPVKGVAYVIHVKAPVNDERPEEEKEKLLRFAYQSALACARAIGARSVAFPLLGAGIYGWDKDKALLIAKETIKAHAGGIKVYLCLYP